MRIKNIQYSRSSLPLSNLSVWNANGSVIVTQATTGSGKQSCAPNICLEFLLVQTRHAPQIVASVIFKNMNSHCMHLVYYIL